MVEHAPTPLCGRRVSDGARPAAPVGRGRRDVHFGLLTVIVAATALALAASVGGIAGWSAGRGAVPSQTATTVIHRPSPAGGGAFDVAGVLQVVERSIVAVHTRIGYQDGIIFRSRPEAATGVVVSSDGLVVTNAHVVEEALSVSVMLPEHDGRHDAVVVETDSVTDVALLRVEGVVDLTPATFGDSDQVYVGDDVVAVGNALDLGRTMSVTRGIISAQGREIDTKQGTLRGLLQTDAAMSSGISGGALVDSTGAVIGMPTAAALRKTGTTVQNIGFAIPSNVVLEVIAGFGVAEG
jgi:S1-C subfamily serine protease